IDFSPVFSPALESQAIMSNCILYFFVYLPQRYVSKLFPKRNNIIQWMADQKQKQNLVVKQVINERQKFVIVRSFVDPPNLTPLTCICIHYSLYASAELAKDVIVTHPER